MKLYDSLPRLSTGVTGAAFALLLISSPVHSQSGAIFAGLGGNWSGTGTIFVADGGSEAIRCRATYTVGTDNMTLKQNLRCASDSYKFELTTDIKSSGGNVTGYWDEATRNIHGTLDGSGSNGQFNVLVTANGFAAELSLAVTGGKQTINMTSKNTDLRGLKISLSKS